MPPRTVSSKARRVTPAVTRTANNTATPNVTPRAVSAYLALRTRRLRYEIVDSERMASDPHCGAAFNPRLDAGRGGTSIQLLEPAQHRPGPSLVGAVGAGRAATALDEVEPAGHGAVAQEQHLLAVGRAARIVCHHDNGLAQQPLRLHEQRQDLGPAAQ